MLMVSDHEWYALHVSYWSVCVQVQNKRTELLNHPLVTTFIAYKWKRAWPLYLANVLFYLVFLSFFTAYALVVPNPQSELCELFYANTFVST